MFHLFYLFHVFLRSLELLLIWFCRLEIILKPISAIFTGISDVWVLVRFGSWFLHLLLRRQQRWFWRYFLIVFGILGIIDQLPIFFGSNIIQNLYQLFILQYISQVIHGHFHLFAIFSVRAVTVFAFKFYHFLLAWLSQPSHLLKVKVVKPLQFLIKDFLLLIVISELLLYWSQILHYYSEIKWILVMLMVGTHFFLNDNWW